MHVIAFKTICNFRYKLRLQLPAEMQVFFLQFFNTSFFIFLTLMVSSTEFTMVDSVVG